MNITQLQLIKTDIAANPDLSSQPNNSDGSYNIAELYNQLPLVSMQVWRTDTPTQAIFDAITWSAYTPNDPADGTQLYQNRCYLIGIKQMNLQTMLTRATLNTANPTTRAGLRDAIIQLPTGTSGAFQSAGGPNGINVLTVCTRNATRIEKLLVNTSQGSDTTGTVTARVMGFEGIITPQDIDAARNS